MKLLWCDVCHSVIQITSNEWRRCTCGRVGGQYNVDEVTATIGGKGRVFGISNPFFSLSWLTWAEETKQEFRRKHYPEGQGSDCWWGNYIGDVQLFWIESSKGPRLKTQSRLVSKKDNAQVIRTVEIRIIDTRKRKIADKLNRRKVIIPANAGTVITYPDKYRIGLRVGEKLKV